MELHGARALVTGGSSGIGLATAELFAARGCLVTITGSDPGRVRRAGATVSRRPLPDAATGVPEQSARAMVCDFGDAQAVAELAGSLAAGPAFDVVVHNAGIGLRRPAAETTGPAVDRLLAVNVRSAIALTAALLPGMLERGSGRLVFVGSIAGAVGAAGEAAYAASKAALAGYAESLRVELAGTGVGVTVLLPGVVDTDFFRRRGMPYHRPRPKPVPVQRVARALVRAVRRDRDLVAVPGWLRVPIALQGIAPQSYGRLAAHWGR